MSECRAGRCATARSRRARPARLRPARRPRRIPCRPTPGTTGPSRESPSRRGACPCALRTGGRSGQGGSAARPESTSVGRPRPGCSSAIQEKACPAGASNHAATSSGRTTCTLVATRRPPRRISSASRVTSGVWPGWTMSPTLGETSTSPSKDPFSPVSGVPASNTSLPGSASIFTRCAGTSGAACSASTSDQTPSGIGTRTVVLLPRRVATTVASRTPRASRYRNSGSTLVTSSYVPSTAPPARTSMSAGRRPRTSMRHEKTRSSLSASLHSAVTAGAAAPRTPRRSRPASAKPAPRPSAYRRFAFLRHGARTSMIAACRRRPSIRSNSCGPSNRAARERCRSAGRSLGVAGVAGLLARDERLDRLGLDRGARILLRCRLAGPPASE